ncbi:hypothetical protein BDV59DRAFT_196949 [Aspergillus ambiguus]|uniref:uncharacterized protein n=1 Tax=Aspergillus ambiguus TaxID=176160 RepID=UPI003CCDEB6A
MASNLPCIALKPAELQVLRSQYEKEGDYVGVQTKFNYAWGLIKSNARVEQQEGVRLLSEIFRAAPERRRECLYYLALGNYKLGNYGEARRYNDLLLEKEPANLQAASLGQLIDEKVSKEGLLGIAIVGGLALAAGVIEIPPDPDEVPPADSSADFPDPPTSIPGERPHSPANPWANHNPWAHYDDDRDSWDPGNGYRYNSYRSPDGRFSFTSTTYTHGSSPHRSRGMPADPLMPMVRGLDTIFNGLAETYRQAGEYRQMGNRVRAQHRDQPPTDAPSDSSTAPQQGPRVWQGSFGFTLGGNGGARSEYHTTGGLHPRDADGPQPMDTPLRTLGDVLELFRADFGGDAGDPAGGPRVGPNPLAMLSALLNLGRHGDAVYSQEELDRVISQLVDQNVNGTAPPPASRSAIESLPKKKVDQEMLGSEGRAECSICMDPVELGTEVTLLPCKHWFHDQCIEMWLNQHNTCPHCRRGIDAPAQ